MLYYLYDGQKAVGPFEPAELAKRPHFGGSALVCPAGATSADAWKPASSFPDLAKALAEAALPPPPPPPPPPPKAIIELTLPAQPASAEAAPEPEAAAAPAPAAPELAPPSEKLLLIVEDDELVRSLLEAATTSQGFRIVSAANGLEASEKIAQQLPDLIVTDLMMPGQGGYEFLRSLPAAGASGIPVFIITGMNLNASTVKMIRQEANVVEFVEKPLQARTFVAALHRHLGTQPPPRRSNPF